MEEKTTELKTKFEAFKMGVKVRYEKAKRWCMDNKEVSLAMATAVIGGIGELGKEIIRSHDRKLARELEEAKRKSVYDRSAGMYLDTTRELTNRDYRKLQAKKRDGLTTGEALDSMGLLK